MSVQTKTKWSHWWRRIREDLTEYEVERVHSRARRVHKIYWRWSCTIWGRVYIKQIESSKDPFVMIMSIHLLIKTIINDPDTYTQHLSYRYYIFLKSTSIMKTSYKLQIAPVSRNIYDLRQESLRWGHVGRFEDQYQRVATDDVRGNGSLRNQENRKCQSYGRWRI